jgi:hypothetical protein
MTSIPSIRSSPAASRPNCCLDTSTRGEGVRGVDCSIAGLGGDASDIKDGDSPPGEADQVAVSEVSEDLRSSFAAGTYEGSKLLMGKSDMDTGGANTVMRAATRESGQGRRDALVDALEDCVGQAALHFNQPSAERFCNASGDPRIGQQVLQHAVAAYHAHHGVVEGLGVAVVHRLAEQHGLTENSPGTDDRSGQRPAVPGDTEHAYAAFLQDEQRISLVPRRIQQLTRCVRPQPRDGRKSVHLRRGQIGEDVYLFQAASAVESGRAAVHVRDPLTSPGCPRRRFVPQPGGSLVAALGRHIHIDARYPVLIAGEVRVDDHQGGSFGPRPR